MDRLKNILEIYWGGSEIEIAFLISLLYVFLDKESEDKKTILFWYPLIVLATLLNPISMVIGDYVWGKHFEYYCRQFSLIPIFYCIAYMMIILIRKLRNQSRKIILTIIMATFVVIMGDNIYKEDWYRTADNIMKIPNDVISICDFVKGDDVTIMVPDTLSNYIRQYDASIHTTTCRGDTSELAIQVNSETPDVEYIMKTCCGNGTDFLVMRNSEVVFDLFEKAGYVPVFNNDNYLVYYCEGYFTTKYMYNEKEQVIERTNYDENGNRCINKYGYSSVKYSYDRNGFIASERYYDIFDKPVKLANGQYGCDFVNDKNGYLLECDFVDEFGNPVSIEAGYSIIRYERDSRGNNIKEMYLSPNDLPVQCAGCYGIQREYDNNNRVVMKTYLDRNGQPFENMVEGISKTKYIYNTDENYDEILYLDINDVPVNNKDGVSVVRKKYQDENVIMELYYDSERKLVNLQGGYSGISIKYDDNGFIDIKVFLDDNMKPVDTIDGYACIKYYRDTDGNILSETYYRASEFEEKWLE